MDKMNQDALLARSQSKLLNKVLSFMKEIFQFQLKKCCKE